jgi:hypothetical protein
LSRVVVVALPETELKAETLGQLAQATAVAMVAAMGQPLPEAPGAVGVYPETP